jgi:hypothetical protein
MIATTQTVQTYSFTPGSVHIGATFNIPFGYQQTSEIKASLVQPGYSSVILVLGVDFNVTAPSPSGGTLTIATDIGVNHPSYGTLVLLRSTAKVNATSVVNGGGIDANVLEYALDELTQMIQESAVVGGTSGNPILAPVTDPAGLNYVLPDNVTRALMALMFDAAGNVIAGLPSGVPINAYWQAGLASATPPILLAALGIPTPMFFDLIIDSNAKLDLWCQAVAGQYKRVYIKAGAWTASALSPTAGVLVNLDSAGTVYVFAEKGSSINYSAAYGGIMYGLYHASLATDMSLERFENVKLNLTNSTPGTADAFENCTNLINCTANVTGTNLYAFRYCTNLVNCTGTGTSSTVSVGVGFGNCTNLVNCVATGICNASGNAYGMSACTNLTNCTAVATVNGGGAGYGYAFFACTHLTNCTGTATGSATGGGVAFKNCNRLNNCVGVGNGGASSGPGYGFDTCITVLGCAGQGLAAGSGVGYGFFGCTKMQQNKPSAGSKTATYNTSYADSGSSNACADTAAGGYNS